MFGRRPSSARNRASSTKYLLLRCGSARSKAVSCKGTTRAAPIKILKHPCATPPLNASCPDEASPLQLSHTSLSGKNILVFGWAASGTAAAQLATVHGASVLGLDEGMDDEQLDTQTKKNIPAPLQRAIETTNCPPNYDELLNFDLVVLSPGVPLKHRLPTQAMACGIPVTSELAFAASMLPKSVEIVCVTGTNGKSTTTTFLAQMLSAMGHRVWAGGNLGQPLSQLAYDAVTDGGLIPHYAAVEVSSYQLEPAGEFPVSAACILNVGADHLDRHQSLEKYAETKAKLVDHLEPGSLTGIISEDIVAHCGNTRALQGCARIGSLPGVIVRNNEAEVLHSYWRRSRNLDLSAQRCPGSHNMVAAFLASAVSPGEQQWCKLQRCIPDLVGLPHRLELVHKDVHGSRWLNDSKATNVESVQAALQTMEDPAVVLLGGMAKRNEKGRLCFQILAPLLKDHTVITFGASAHEIKFELQESGVCISAVCDSLKEAVTAARAAKARAGVNTVLLSPGCASFDEFADFVDRGHKFTAYATGQL